MKTNRPLVVIGREPFGHVLAEIAGKSDRPVHVWENVASFPDDAVRIIAEAKAILFATSIGQVELAARAIAPNVSGDQILMHTARGIVDGNKGFTTASEIIRNNTCLKKIGIITGPISKDGSPFGIVAASTFPEVVQCAKSAFSTATTMVFQNRDMAGIELGAAMGRVFTLAIGIARGQGFGAATLALLTARALTEMARLGIVTGASPGTFSGLSGLGELVTALTVDEHPLVTTGLKMAKGEAYEESEMLEETLSTLKAAVPFARKKRLAMPILYALDGIALKGRPAMDEIAAIFATAVGQEQDPTVEISDSTLPIPTLAPPGGKK